MKLARRILAFFASLKLTIALLAAATVLVFVATLDMVHLGLHDMVEIYFRRFISYYDFRRGGGWDAAANAVIPPTPFFRLWLPGGYTIGALLLVNLIASHATRFKWRREKAGIQIIHFGIILILLGELFTGLWARETQMYIDEGATANFSSAPREVELAFVDVSDPGREKHFAIDESSLEKGAQIAHPGLPFRVEVLDYLPNARLHAGSEPGAGWERVPADRGAGVGAWWARLDRARGLDDSDVPAILVRLHDGSRPVGTWLAGRQIANAQRFTSPDGREWDLSLRGRREYKPFSITLRDFQHTRYPGTEIPKDFSSFVTLTEPDQRLGRDIRIWMNHPLRHGGYTFYQSSFANNDTTSILLVVRNPTWILPYVSCVLVFAGLTLQFVLSLLKHLGKRRTAA
jgi:hypothetical protein